MSGHDELGLALAAGLVEDFEQLDLSAWRKRTLRLVEQIETADAKSAGEEGHVALTMRLFGQGIPAEVAQ